MLCEWAFHTCPSPTVCVSMMVTTPGWWGLRRVPLWAVPSSSGAPDGRVPASWVTTFPTIVRPVFNVWQQDRDTTLKRFTNQKAEVVYDSDAPLFFYTETENLKKKKKLNIITKIKFWQLNSSLEHNLIYFSWNLRVFWPCIDSNATDTFKAQSAARHACAVVLSWTCVGDRHGREEIVE